MKINSSIFHYIRPTLGRGLGVGFLLLLFANCGHKTQQSNGRDTITMHDCPTFVAANAMRHIEAQCAFGPRVPGTPAWKTCGDSIVVWFSALGLTVEEQNTIVKAYNGEKLPCRNIRASLNPESIDRILLCAHWDSRPWADNDPNLLNHKKPVMAANDGASGVAVLLELARLLSADTTINTGIDFVCFDVEDYGTPQWDYNGEQREESTWCLGSRAWTEQAAQQGYQARYGILFDMVGGRGSTFSKESLSLFYAQPIVEKLWHIAQQLGYGQFFPLSEGSSIIDDHLNVNQIAHIPCIDIVPYHMDGPSPFGPTWHTVSDTPENIDPNVLEAVGQSVLQLIYNDERRTP